jgi:hypothetical protein
MIRKQITVKHEESQIEVFLKIMYFIRFDSLQMSDCHDIPNSHDDSVECSNKVATTNTLQRHDVTIRKLKEGPDWSRFP